MHNLKKTNVMGYEDLMRELAILEHKLLPKDQSSAMALMVLEAKIRDRFQQLEFRVIQSDPTYQEHINAFKDDFSLEEIQDLVPHELPEFPTFEQMEKEVNKKKIWETVGMAAVLAVITALGVFGLASLIHLSLSWLA